MTHVQSLLLLLAPEILAERAALGAQSGHPHFPPASARDIRCPEYKRIPDSFSIENLTPVTAGQENYAANWRA